MRDDPDAALLDRFVHGDLDAFEAIFRQFELEVFRWILRIVRDRSAAEDAVVDTFWRAYRSRARFDPTRSFGAWMRRIATNAALNQLRAARARGVWIDLDERMPAPAHGDQALRSAVAAAFQALPPKLRLVAVLAIVEQLPYSEIAEALGVPIGTVKSRAFRATRRLREQLLRLGVQP